MRAEKTRNVTQRDWPVLTKLWTGKMNIAITEISKPNIMSKHNVIYVDTLRLLYSSYMFALPILDSHVR